MRPYVLRDVPKGDLRLFKEIRRTMRELPDIDLGRDARGDEVPVSCHMVCRALAAHFPAACRDGYFGKHLATHSWLLTEHGLIIDPYPWAMVGGPVLVCAEGLSPWRELYCEADLADDFTRMGEAFTRGVAAVTSAVEALRRPRYDF